MKANSKTTAKASGVGKTSERSSQKAEQNHDRIQYLTSLIANISDALIATDQEFNVSEWKYGG